MICWTYSDKINGSKAIINAINGLSDNEYCVVSYGTDYNGEPKKYRIRCHIYKDGKPSYSIYKDDVWGLEGMNIDSISKTTAKAYTYDMMGQRTTYNFPIYEMTLVDQPFLETTHNEKF